MFGKQRPRANEPKRFIEAYTACLVGLMILADRLPEGSHESINGFCFRVLGREPLPDESAIASTVASCAILGARRPETAHELERAIVLGEVEAGDARA